MQFPIGMSRLATFLLKEGKPKPATETAGVRSTMWKFQAFCVVASSVVEALASAEPEA